MRYFSMGLMLIPLCRLSLLNTTKRLDKSASESCHVVVAMRERPSKTKRQTRSGWAEYLDAIRRQKGIDGAYRSISEVTLPRFGVFPQDTILPAIPARASSSGGGFHLHVMAFHWGTGQWGTLLQREFSDNYEQSHVELTQNCLFLRTTTAKEQSVTVQQVWPELAGTVVEMTGARLQRI